jgi:type II secretory pathway pseudopilin PulG
MTLHPINAIALVLALIAFVVSGFGLSAGTAAQSDLRAAVATAQAQTNQAQAAIERLSVVDIGPAHVTGVPNVARNPADVPAPLTRTEPATVRFTLTVKEVTAQLADGATYDYRARPAVTGDGGGYG